MKDNNNSSKRLESLHGISPGWGEPRVLLLDYQQSKVIVDSVGPDSVFHRQNQQQQLGEEAKSHSNKKLNVLMSISIAGCDLMGSSLYTAGVCAYNSGKVIFLILYNLHLSSLSGMFL
jgi:hypothetical protein